LSVPTPMRGVLMIRTIGRMSAKQTASLRLDVRLDAQPISGEVSTDSGPSGSFSGWTELFALLEVTLKDARANAERGLRDDDQPHAHSEKGNTN
jgi:hypothetical protein